MRWVGQVLTHLDPEPFQRRRDNFSASKDFLDMYEYMCTRVSNRKIVVRLGRWSELSKRRPSTTSATTRSIESVLLRAIETKG